MIKHRKKIADFENSDISLSGIHKIHTSCKDCIFAKYNGNTQEWCNANYLKNDFNFVKHIHGPLIEAFDKELNNSFPKESPFYETKEFFIINGIYCYGKRKKKWGDRFKEDKWLDQLKIENQLYYQVIIFANNSFEDTLTTLKSLLRQKIKPKHVTIVRPFGNEIKPTLLVEYLQDYFQTNDIKWNMQNIANADLRNEQIIDMIINSKPLPYYSVFHARFNIPQDFFSNINDKIYDNTLKFAILLPNSADNGMVVSTSIHKIYDGNKQSTLIEKIRKDKGDELLIPITQICPNCPK